MDLRNRLISPCASFTVQAVTRPGDPHQRALRQFVRIGMSQDLSRVKRPTASNFPDPDFGTVNGIGVEHETSAAPPAPARELLSRDPLQIPFVPRASSPSARKAIGHTIVASSKSHNCGKMVFGSRALGC
jgi:hypothetical protein